jgi:hypothetical protein
MGNMIRRPCPRLNNLAPARDNSVRSFNVYPKRLADNAESIERRDTMAHLRTIDKHYLWNTRPRQGICSRLRCLDSALHTERETI